MYNNHSTRIGGFMLIEMIIVSAITVIVFGALFVTFQSSLELLATSRAKLSAQSLANERMEYFRSLSYDDVGVVSGFPAGTIPQTSTLLLNGITFTEDVRVDYVDDPADDIAGVDGNGIITDYKRIKLSYEWDINGETKELSLITNIVPRSIETDVGGGTVRVNVLDANSNPLPNATVWLTSASTTFTYADSNPTNSAGAALFTVPADSGYSVEVSAFISGEQYSTSSTYAPTTYLANPTNAPFAVVEAGISTQTFIIDALSDLALSVKSAVVEDSVLEPFSDVSGIALSTDTSVSGGDLVLADTAGVYELTGTAYINTIVPTAIENWESIRVAPTIPANTNFVLQLFTGDAIGGYTLVPDGDLPGNSTGFTDTLVDISDLDPVAYATTTIGITLTTTDTSVTPAIDELEIFWRESDTDLGSLTMDVRGDKTIGTEADLTPVYKSTSTITTDASGEYDFFDIEYDMYTFTPTGAYDLAAACSAHPFNLAPGVSADLELVYVSDASHTLRVSVVDTIGRPVPGATVQLQRSGYNVTQTTGSCGQTFFTGGLSDNSDYTLTVSAPGFTTDANGAFTVSGDTTSAITLAP